MSGLCAFALRRTLALWLLGGLVLLFVLAARASHGEAIVAGDAEAQAVLRALVRQNVWSVLFLAAPLLFLLAARLGRPAANAWLAPTASTPLARALALALGAALACAMTTALTAAAGEAAVPGGFPSWRRARLAESPRVVLVDSEPRVRWRVSVPEEAATLRLETTVAVGSGPAVTARFQAEAGGQRVQVEQRIGGRTELTLPLPRGGERTFALELERVDEGALLVLPPGALEVLVPATSERLAAPALAAHAFLVLASGCALAFGLARVLRPGLAAGLVGTLALAASGTSFPWPAWREAWSQLGAALVPAAPSAAACIGSAGVFALGILLQSRGGGRA